MRRVLATVLLLSVIVLMVGIGDVSAASRPIRGIHVYLIDMKGVDGTPPYHLKAVVFVRSEYNKAVKNAYVTATNATPQGGVDYITKRTNVHGKATWTMESNLPGVWMICVTNISKVGYEYQYWKNHDLCQAIYYP